MVRLLASDDPRRCLSIGAAIGLGMLTKYTMMFLTAGIATGFLLTPARRFLRSPWLWCGIALALVIFLPNLLWQMRHHFVSLDFLKSIHARDISIGRTDSFVLDQFWIATNPPTVPLWLAGLFYLFATPDGKRYRPIGWMFIVPFVLFVVGKARGYYLAPGYPMLFAAGAVWGERWVASLITRRALVIRRTTWMALAIEALVYFSSRPGGSSPRGRPATGHIKVQFNIRPEISSMIDLGAAREEITRSWLPDGYSEAGEHSSPSGVRVKT